MVILWRQSLFKWKILYEELLKINLKLVTKGL